MPRTARPFNNEPRPLPPDPVAYAANPDGLLEARRDFKKRYDSWQQRRRRAVARGEVVANARATASPPPLAPPHPTPQGMPAPIDPPMPPAAAPVVPTAVEAQSLVGANPNMMLMIPASMISLLATARPAEA